MSRLLHAVFLVVAAMAFCLTAQQLHHVNGLAAAQLDRRASQEEARAFFKSGPPPSVEDIPGNHNDPAPPTFQVATPTASLHDRETNGGTVMSDESDPRPTKIKTPAAQTTPPTNTKVPVASTGRATVSDPGFLALAASLSVLTLGMALV